MSKSNLKIKMEQKMRAFGVSYGSSCFYSWISSFLLSIQLKTDLTSSVNLENNASSSVTIPKQWLGECP